MIKLDRIDRLYSNAKKLADHRKHAIHNALGGKVWPQIFL